MSTNIIIHLRNKSLLSIDTDKNPPIDTLRDPPKNGKIAHQTAPIFD